MERTTTRSQGPGHIAIEENGASGNVGSDGRVKVQFHEDAQTLVDWCARFQQTIDGHKDFCEDKPPKERRTSSIGLLQAGDIPLKSPRLNIAVHIVGSRGDVQPFIPIAQILSRPPYNHRVRICTHPVFKEFVEAQGVEFFSIGGDPEALMAYMVKNPGLLPNRKSFKDGDIPKRRKEMLEIMEGCWRSCIEAGDGMGPPITAANVRDVDDLFLADAIIANPPSMAHIHCAEKLSIPLHMVFTMPWSPTSAFPHPLAAMSYGDADMSAANYLSFMVMELLTWQGLGDLINKVRRQTLHLDPVSPMWGHRLHSRLRVSYSYLWSQSLIAKPIDWGSHIKITGFSFLALADSYTPPPDLVAFLDKGPPPIYIGFGSIVVDDPQGLTQMIFEAVKTARVRAIVSKGWGGVGGNDMHVPENIYLIGSCPHDWLFKRVSAVVHHGGAGTTAAGIAAGRPTVVVPFFGDQPFWGQMLARAGAGPMPIPFKDMTAESLAESIEFALKPEVQKAAQKMSQQIAQENGAQDTADDIQDRLKIDQLRCDVCPERLATWVHKKTDAHLSGFAVACLFDESLVQGKDIELIRHQTWYVDEGAEHPLIGMAAAASGLVRDVATATSDYADRLKGRTRRRANSVATLPGHERSSLELEPIESVALDDPSRIINNATPKDMQKVVRGKVRKSLNTLGLATNPLMKPRNKRRIPFVARATGRYGIELSKAGLKAPVAFFYNIANGFHNFPSYMYASVDVRRRDEIIGLSSGLKVAGKEFGLGMWEAFSGIVVRPYTGARDEGGKGFGKGIWRGYRGLVCNMGCALFGLVGYPLKGVEMEIHKHHLGELKAEILLIRLRQGIDDYRRASLTERAQAVKRWKMITSELDA